MESGIERAVDTAARLIVESARVVALVVSGLSVAILATSCAGEPATATPGPPPVSPGGPAASPTAVQMPTPTPEATPEVAHLSKMSVEKAFPGLSFRGMVHLTYPDDGSNRLFVVLQPGQVMVFDNDRDTTSAETFLDIRDQVNDQGSEEGLLGLAFDPQFRANGHFYVYYSASPPKRSVISRYSVRAGEPSRADPASEVTVLQIPQPFSNHNGGQLLFGPDGYLYVGLGDGGSGGDPQGNGQDPSTLLGSILRIDVSAAPGGAYLVPPDNPFVGREGDARAEIWAYGLRNPWRFSFDRETGELWAADVGQNKFEEVDIIRPGGNYGWNIMEGSYCFLGRLTIAQLLKRGSAGPDRNCDQEGLEPPIIDYDHDEGCSVTGGYVYRGSRLPSLYGAYVYGDFCSGKIWALTYDGARVTELLEIVDSQLSIPAFGEDPAGELYILSFDGSIYRLTRP